MPQRIKIHPANLTAEALFLECEQLMDQLNSQVALGVSLEKGKEKQSLIVVVITPQIRLAQNYFYGGAPENGPTWACHMSLDFLRRNLN